MRLLRRLIPFLLILLIFIVVWVWWNRPKKVDMAAYVPADALLYLEANSLPQIVQGLTQTEGWKALAEPAGVKAGLGSASWLSRLGTWIGIGSTDTIVFSRMQVAAVVLSVAAADGGETLNVKPRIAIVVETHTGAGRTLAFIEKRVGNFAHRAYPDAQVETRDIDGAHWIVWSSMSSERRIFAAVVGSVAIIGNHETAVQACLAVMRGQRPSLAGNLELEEARRHLATSDSLALGFMSSQGAANLFEIGAAVYMGQISEDAATQGVAANILPKIASKIVGSVGWSTRLAQGRVEDDYFISTTNDAGARLRSALAPAPANAIKEAALLPVDTYSLTRYSTHDPLSAWRGLSFSLSSQLDPVLAVMVPPFLKATLHPYGIEEPDPFLQAVGPILVTARLENGGKNTVLLVEVRDEKALREFVLKKLGPTKPQVERVGEAEMLSAIDEKLGAASFVDGLLLMGPKESIRRCLSARYGQPTLLDSRAFQTTLGTASLASPSHVVTLTRDSQAARDFMVFVANQHSTHGRPINVQVFETTLGQLPYAVSEMKFVDGGIERRTTSSFGLLGVLARQFSTKN